MVPAATLHATLRGMAAIGLDAPAFADGAGVSGWNEAPPSDPFAVAPPDAFSRVWAAAFRARPLPHLPALVGGAVPFGAFGLTDHLVGSAPTLQAGIEALADHARLVAAASRLEVERPWLYVETGPAEGDVSAWTHPRAVGDLFTIAVVTSRFRSRIGGRPDEVRLVHDGIDSAPFQALFGVPVRLGCTRSGVALSHAAWSEPLGKADLSLHAVLATLAASSSVQSYAQRPLAHAVRSRLGGALASGAFTAADLAQALGMSRRTLQRRLSGEGTTFGAIVDDYRRDASRRLMESGASVGDAAARLGYTEATSFTRAFRRWHGTSPSGR